MDGNAIISVRQTAPTGTGDPRASWSRRRFVTEGLLTLAAAPAVARVARGGGATNPPDLSTAGATPGAAKNTGSGAVRAASQTDNRLTTAVYVNGTGPYRFLVDTGAERSLLASEIAAKLALPQGAQVMVRGIVRGQAASLAETQSMRMGTLVCPPLEVPTLPRTMLKVDGFLGLDVLDGHRVIFDFREETLTVERPQGFFSALWAGGANEAVVHTLGSSGRLRATNCIVNGIRAAAFVDSGAEVSVINPALYAALRARAPTREVMSGMVGLYGVTGGMMEGPAVNIDEITLGALHLTYTPMVAAGLEVFDLWGLSRQPALLFGMDCLRRFRRVSIDYGRKELRFEVASAQDEHQLQAGLSPRLAARAGPLLR